MSKFMETLNIIIELFDYAKYQIFPQTLCPNNFPILTVAFYQLSRQTF